MIFIEHSRKSPLVILEIGPPEEIIVFIPALFKHVFQLFVIVERPKVLRNARRLTSI